VPTAMALSIKNVEAEQLANEVAKRTGETMTQAVIVSLRERLERVSGRRRAPVLRETLAELSRRCSALPDVDKRTPDEILGYDAQGTFSAGKKRGRR